MPKVELHPHQEKAVGEMHNGCILAGGTGSGKSITACAYYMKQEADADVYVITTAKKRDSLDWEEEFSHFGVGYALDGTLAGRLTVDSWQNIGKYRDVVGAFFIFDEQRLVGSGEWSNVFLKIAKKNRWILLSATPGDNWLDYIPVFVANGFYKNRTEFKREHVIYNNYSRFPKVERYVGVSRLVKQRNDLLVEMPYLKHTTRLTVEIPVQHDKQLFEKVVKDRWHVYEHRPLRDVSELFSVMRKVVNSAPSRLEACTELLQKHSKVIVFYNFDYELELLRNLKFPSNSLENQRYSTEKSVSKCDSSSLTTHPSAGMDSSTNPKDGLLQTSKSPNSTKENSSCPIHSLVGTTSSMPDTTPTRSNNTLPVSRVKPVSRRSGLGSAAGGSSSSKLRCGCTFQIAEWNGHKHEPIPNTDRWLYLVQYAAGSEGWNCVETDTTLFYSLNYSYKMWHQAHGRTDRLNTLYTVLNYYVLMSNSLIDKAIKKALDAKRSFNESKFSQTSHSKFTGKV
jgi:hypothetical protein